MLLPPVSLPTEVAAAPDSSGDLGSWALHANSMRVAMQATDTPAITPPKTPATPVQKEPNSGGSVDASSVTWLGTPNEDWTETRGDSSAADDINEDDLLII